MATAIAVRSTAPRVARVLDGNPPLYPIAPAPAPAYVPLAAAPIPPNPTIAKPPAGQTMGRGGTPFLAKPASYSLAPVLVKNAGMFVQKPAVHEPDLTVQQANRPYDTKVDRTTRAPVPTPTLEKPAPGDKARIPPQSGRALCGQPAKSDKPVPGGLQVARAAGGNAWGCGTAVGDPDQVEVPAGGPAKPSGAPSFGLGAAGRTVVAVLDGAGSALDRFFASIFGPARKSNSVVKVGA